MVIGLSNDDLSNIPELYSFRERQMKCLLVLSLAISLLGGCATPKSIFHWGNYEELIYDMYLNTDQSDPVTQIGKLNTDIQQAQDSGKRVAPGVYAHLGFMHMLQGNAVKAQASFDQEKRLYPEASVFIDSISARALTAGTES